MARFDLSFPIDHFNVTQLVGFFLCPFTLSFSVLLEFVTKSLVKRVGGSEFVAYVVH